MSICSFCGWENGESARYCEYCSTVLASSAPVVAEAKSTITDEGPHIAPETAPAVRLQQVAAIEKLGDRETLTLEEMRESLPELVTPATKLRAPKAPGADSADAKLHLVVVRGERLDMHYHVNPGKNFVGRTDEKPVDIDLECQEPLDQILVSRQHAVINFDNGVLTVEDLNSLNGTFVNRTRIYPGQVRTLQPDDIVQFGKVQMRLELISSFA